MKDYYYILGLPETATNEAIKQAYKKLSKKFHPDLNDGDKFFEERFKEILEAYQILIDETKRKYYDANRHNNHEISLKQCLFCNEFINNEAIKCIFCGEWVTTQKDSTLFELIKTVNNYYDEEMTSLKQSATANNTIAGQWFWRKINTDPKKSTTSINNPSLEIPLIIEGERKNVFVYSDRIGIQEWDNKEWKHKQIIYYYYHNIIYIKGNFMHDYRNTCEITQEIGFYDEDSNKINTVNIDHYLRLGLYGDKNEFIKRQVLIVYYFILKTTFNIRIKQYIEKMEVAGYFIYKSGLYGKTVNFKFYDNGDIKEEEIFIGNIKQEASKNRILIGSIFNRDNPEKYIPNYFSNHVFIILMGVPKFLKFLGSDLDYSHLIDISYDHDVFCVLIKYFIKKGKYPTLKELNS